MMPSQLFHSSEHIRIAEQTRSFLNSHGDILSENTATDQRSAGGAVQDILSKHFDSLLGNQYTGYKADFEKKSMADFVFKDKDDNYYVVDVKTHCEDTKFNMPNLTSVKRLAKLYEDDTNYFVLLLIHYSVEDTSINVTKVDFFPIEFLDWDCLTFGALGIGQIQIRNSNKIVLNQKNSRKEWMLSLCDKLLAFYHKEAKKIQKRIEYFEKVKSRWEKR